jgi:hypothetical protein
MWHKRNPEKGSDSDESDEDSSNEENSSDSNDNKNNSFIKKWTFESKFLLMSMMLPGRI